MELFSSSMRGLWVGTALGELYTSGSLASPQNSELTVGKVLPKTYGLTLLATRQIRHLVPDREAFGLRCPRWQDMLLNTVPSAFLHPAGTQGLSSTLSTWLSEPHQRERLVSALVLVQSLEWFQQRRAPADLIPFLLDLPSLQQTQTATHLETAHHHLTHQADLQSLKLQNGPDGTGQWTPGLAISRVLYAVLSTPTDFRLVVQRATLLLGGQPELVTLAAALVGFQTGLAALPLNWRRVLKTLRWDVTVPFEAGLCTLADLCAAQWAGCASFGVPTDAVFHVPGQLRPR
jgi:hypothetical protein